MNQKENILHRILLSKRAEVQMRRAQLSLEQVKEQAKEQTSSRPFIQALQTDDGSMALIAEIKKASPSAGLIRKNFNPSLLAQSYEQGGAHALSILTDEPYFQGHLEYLRQARSSVKLPCLRKDFILTEYQIWEARAAGADAVLLIVAALSPDELSFLLGVTETAGLDVLVEVHHEAELEIALKTSARLIGINNRNLEDFIVDLGVTERLAKQIPSDRLIVSESGIYQHEDLVRLKKSGVRAVLVGESLMRQNDVRKAVENLLLEKSKTQKK